MTGPDEDEARFLEDWAGEWHQRNTIQAIAEKLAEAPIAEPSPNGRAAAGDDLPPVNVPLDWEEEFRHDYSVVNWLPGKICERGQQVAFVGDGKVGKSLFWFEWAWRAVSGQEFLYPVDCKPLTIVYCDRENSRRDLVMRAQALGATAGSLIRLVYYSFPQLPNLDVNGSGVLEFADRAGGDVVVLDTVSRFVGGKENDAETWLGLYRSVHARLKAAGRTGVRLDHPGKDAEKGARGSSAKNQDVDVVWEMTGRGEREHGPEVTTDLRLTRTHTRTGIGPSVIDLVRRGRKDEQGLWVPGSTSHRLAERAHAVAPADPKIMAAVAKLDQAGAEPMWGRDRLARFAADESLGIRLTRTDDWGKVAKYRKDAEQERRLSMESGDPWAEEDPFPDVR